MNLSSVVFASLLFNFSLQSMHAINTDYFKSLPESTQKLVAAVHFNETANAINLLKAGVKPNASLNIYGRPYGEELVTVAARNCNEELLKELFHSGAPVYGLYGEPVRSAAHFGNVETLVFLLDHGASIQSAQEGLSIAKSQKDLTAENCLRVQEVIDRYKSRL